MKELLLSELIMTSFTHTYVFNSWRRHQMEHFLWYWPVVRGIHWSPVNSCHKGQWRFDVFLNLCLNRWLSKQSIRQWFKMPSHSLWHHCNVVSLSLQELIIRMKDLYTIYIPISNKRLPQMWAPLVACRKPAVVQNRWPNGLHVFEHKT